MRTIPGSKVVQIDLFQTENDLPQEISPKTVSLLARLLREHAEKSPPTPQGTTEVIDE